MPQRQPGACCLWMSPFEATAKKERTWTTPRSGWQVQQLVTRKVLPVGAFKTLENQISSIDALARLNSFTAKRWLEKHVA